MIVLELQFSNGNHLITGQKLNLVNKLGEVLFVLFPLRNLAVQRLPNV